MKFITRILLALFLFAPLAAHADAPSSKQTKAEELLKLTHMDQLMSQMLGQMTERMKASADQQAASMHMTPEQKTSYDDYQQKLDQLLASYLNWDKMKPVMVQAYSETYTDQELDGILNFYRSAAGQAMVAKSPELMTKTRTAMMQQIGALQPQVEQLTKDFAEKMKQSTPAPATTPAAK
jgi:uncharacterized protein